jgi:hypothetical protein
MTHAKPWDADPQVRSPVGRPIAELLAEQPRRQDLPGFEPVYADIVDYILRCTHRIWEEKNIGLCRTHYSADCPMVTLGGPTNGAEEVVRNTLTSIAGAPDRSPVAEDVIWSEDAPGVFLSSHRITSLATQLGDDPMLGPANGRRRGVRVIADCLCRENMIVEEWLVRDNVQLAREMGVDPHALARQQAAADRTGDQARHNWRAQQIDAIRTSGLRMPPAEHPAFAMARALDLAFNQDLFGEAASIAAESSESWWPSGRHAFGRSGWIGCLLQLRSALENARWSLDHWAARPLPDGEVAVALRWWLSGRQSVPGPWGAPTGRDLLVLGISHYRLRDGRMLEDVTIYDELAVLRQAYGGLGA